MSKSLFIAEKPSVAQQFADALKIRGRRSDGYIESEDTIVTWCVGHLVTMSYPEAYDMKYKRWSLNTLPFLPKEFKYEVIPNVGKQFSIVKGLLTRPDVDTIYVCTDSGREGEYIYRLVAQMAGVKDKQQKRVWIDSQTEEEILRGIHEAKDESEYDNLSASAYLRAKEDYLMGINFSRVLTLRYGPSMSQYLGTKFTVLSVGRVMTCVLGMVVRREREIRNFVKTPFYRVLGSFQAIAKDGTPILLDAEWKAVEGSKYFKTPYLYKENGFKEREKAEELIAYLKTEPPLEVQVLSKEKKKETKNPPLLYNLAELQNDCSKMFKISPDETLKVVQELYEKKLVTYPRTDARVLSTAVAKEIYKNISGLMHYEPMAGFAKEAIDLGSFKMIGKTRYVNDKQITDHYAIIPTGQGLGNLRGLSPLGEKVYQVVCRRFLSIFYPAAIYQKYSIVLERKNEQFFANFKVLSEPGYLKVADVNLAKKNSIQETFSDEKEGNSVQTDEKNTEIPKVDRTLLLQVLADLKKNDILTIADLRAQIKGSGIGTSATRAEILKKLVSIKYLGLNQKTQVITPSLLGEMVYEVVDHSIRQLLNPELTASWEKGLTYVAEGSITSDEYMEKLERFVAMRTVNVTRLNNQYDMRELFDAAAAFYKTKKEN